MLLFEKGSCGAAQAGFELTILLLLPSGFWDYRPVLLFPALGEMDLKIENDATATMVGGGKNRQWLFTSLGG